MKMKFILLFGIYALYYTQVFAGAGGLGTRSNVRLAAGTPVHISQRVQLKKYESLNLKHSIEAKVVSSTPITVSLADFSSICSPGNTWLAYNADRSFTMNVGTANSTSSQNWTLPGNFEDNFDGAERIDFIDIPSIPAALRITGANRASVGYYYDQDDRIMKVYAHYNLSSTKIEQLGKSYDLVSGNDDLFDEPDFDITNVPMALGDNFSVTVDEFDYITDQNLFQYVQNFSVDGYGQIVTPEGTFSCLRINVLTTSYQRNNESQPFSQMGTGRIIGFFTREGLFFYGTSSGTSGNVQLSELRYRIVVPTSELTELGEVKINNDGHGVTINLDDDESHPSAILDVKSDSLGVLIPRVAYANLPKNPATGLLVYVIDYVQGFFYYNGANWSRLVAVEPSTLESFPDGKSKLSNPISSVLGGQGQLVNGRAFVQVPDDLNFANIKKSIITLQPEGDCKGLYIKNKTENGFEVQEIGRGKSNISFTYLIKQSDEKE